MVLPPGPRLPALAQTLLWIRRPIEVLYGCRARYGDVFTLKIGPLGRVVVVSRPELIKRIFTGDGDRLRAGEVNAVVGPLVGEHSVLLLDGQQHLRHRRMMLPPFHGERMRLYASTMQQITERQLATFPDDQSFSLHPHMQTITLEVILRTVFGVDEASRLAGLRDQLTKLLSIAESPLAALSLMPALRRELPLSPYRRFMRDKARADDLIYNEIARRRAQGASGSNRTDVLALLLSARDEDGHQLGDVELRDELMTLLVAGHETTATALCWAFERILSAPVVYARLREEQDRVVGNEPLGSEHFSRFEYLDATIHEVLRLRPIIPMVGRRLHAPLSLGDWELPEGVVVAPSIYLTHRNPAIYDDPETFRPERFLGKRPDPYAWFPFGGGIRRCLGMAFALYEMKVVMATLLAAADLELAEPAPLATVRRSITFSPRGGTRVRVVQRREVPRVPRDTGTSTVAASA
jgi:cytochrome P450